MTDTYSLSLPPVEVYPPGKEPPPPPAAAPGVRTTRGPKPAPDDPSAEFEDYKPSKKAEPSKVPVGEAPDPSAGFESYVPPAAPGREGGPRKVSGGESVIRGAAKGITFGFTPAIAGLTEAAGETGQQAREAAEDISPDNPFANEAVAGSIIAQPFIGAANLLHNWFSDHPDPSVTEAYTRGREAALKDEEAANAQHPWAFFGGQMLGSMVAPGLGGTMAPATAGVRIARGMAAGGIGGGLVGAGEATSRGESPAGVGRSALTSAAIGAPLGGAITGAIGPRAVQAASPGQRAAVTAERLGAPLPRAAASDRPGVQAAGGAAMSMPFVGPRISRQLRDVEEAAGAHVEDTAARMGAPMVAGRPQGRAVTGTLVNPGIEATITLNQRAIDAAYNAMRSQINQAQRFTMPRTDRVLNEIMRVRHEAHWPNPAEGLDRFRTAAGGSTVNGAHRLRADAANMGNPAVPHPGYNAADFNRIRGAMTADMREMVQEAATNQTPAGRAAALRAFDEAERRYGPLAEIDTTLDRLRQATAEGRMTELLGKANAKSGDIAMLSHLRNNMPPQEFEMIGGQLLSELGHMPRTGEFSLAQFATEFNKLSDGAVRALYGPRHAAQLREIADMASHIKKLSAQASSSKSSNWYAVYETAKDAAIAAWALASGEATKEMVGGAIGGTGVMMAMGWMLGNPVRTAAYNSWLHAFTGLVGNPAPGRQAVFNIATRNLAHTLGVPVDRLTETIRHGMLTHAQPPAEQKTEQKNSNPQVKQP